MLKKKTSGAYSSVTAVKKKVSGAWSNASTVYKKASGAWSLAWRQPWTFSLEGTGTVSSNTLYVYAKGPDTQSEVIAQGMVLKTGDKIAVKMRGAFGANSYNYMKVYVRGDDNQVAWLMQESSGSFDTTFTQTLSFSGSNALFHAYVTHKSDIGSSTQSYFYITSITVNNYQVFPAQ